MWYKTFLNHLVGGVNPSEKYESTNLPSILGNIKKNQKKPSLMSTNLPWCQPLWKKSLKPPTTCVPCYLSSSPLHLRQPKLRNGALKQANNWRGLTTETTASEIMARWVTTCHNQPYSTNPTMGDDVHFLTCEQGAASWCLQPMSPIPKNSFLPCCFPDITWRVAVVKWHWRRT